MIFILFLINSGCVIPTDHWAYENIRKLQVMGYFGNLYGNTQPYTREQVIQEIRKAEKKLQSGGSYESKLASWLIDELKQEFGGLDKSNALAVTARPNVLVNEKRVRGRFLGESMLDVKGRVSVYHRFELDSYGAQDADFRGKAWRGDITGMTDYADVRMTFDWLGIGLGRTKMKWGYGRTGQLLISDRSPSFDRIELTADFGPVRLLSWSGRLNSFGDDEDMIQRYLSTHRISWKLKNRVEIAASELVVFGGINRGFELYYLNPLLLYYGEQHNSRLNDNVLWNFEITYSLHPGWLLYGEYMIDDFQYESETEPNETAFLVGIDWISFLGVNVEYTRVETWTYGQSEPWNVYSHYNSIIGHSIGADGDLIHVSLDKRLAKSLSVGVSFAHRRKGEMEFWSPRKSVVPFVEFPSGVMEEQNRWRVNLSLLKGVRARLVASAGYLMTRNTGHVQGKFSEDLSFSVGFSCYLPVWGRTLR